MPGIRRCRRNLHGLCPSIILNIIIIGSVRLAPGRAMTTTSSSSSSETFDPMTTNAILPSHNSSPRMPRILCLHGRCQSGAMFSNKIGGARRKLAKVYQLDFLDALYPVSPIVNATNGHENDDGGGGGTTATSTNGGGLGWWSRHSDGTHDIQQIHAAMEYVRAHIQAQEEPYDAVVGFSQGGLLATALVLSGDLGPGMVRAVITASSPYVPDVLEVAKQRADGATRPTTNNNNKNDDDNENNVASSCWEQGLAVPKLHFAGETDTMIPTRMVEQLCDMGGNGRIVLHDKGHLFPTNAIHVNVMMGFLQEHVPSER